MPNHIHAMVEIINPSYDVKTNVANPVVGKSNNDAETNGRLILPISPNGLPVIKRYQPIHLPKSISSFIAGFKSAVNTKIDDYIDENKMDIPKYNRNNHFFQPNYHDHIVRNQIEYDNIYNYIINNPNLWDLDSINTEKSIK
jgi:putative transposase